MQEMSLKKARMRARVKRLSSRE